MTLLVLQLFLEVHLRGGYDVCVLKQLWPELCASQGVHPQVCDGLDGARFNRVRCAISRQFQCYMACSRPFPPNDVWHLTQTPASNAQPNTPAAAALRAHYERCLLDFEDYVTSGQFETDVQTNRLPPLDRLLEIPGAVPAVKREFGHRAWIVCCAEKFRPDDLRRCRLRYSCGLPGLTVCIRCSGVALQARRLATACSRAGTMPACSSS